MPWNLSRLAEVLKNQCCFKNQQLANIVIDSRLINYKDIFVALPGKNSDGHDHILMAINNGAHAAIVEYIPANVPSNFPCLLVNNTLEALAILAKIKQQESKAFMIALTGSVGKSTTKELLKLIFQQIAPTFASYKNYNNELGVNINLANLSPNDRYSIFELGMNHADEISPLSKLLQPDLAIITNVNSMHLEHFNSIEEIAQAKAEIFNGLTHDSTIILNKDDHFFPLLFKRAEQHNIKQIYTFAHLNRADFQLLDYQEQLDHSIIKANIANNIINYRLNSLGRHLAINSITAIGAAFIAGIDLNFAASSLLNFTPLTGRGNKQIITKGQKTFTIIDESYNAGPTSMIAALDVLSSTKAKRKLAILADMNELGANSAAFHQQLGPIILSKNIDKVITIGNEMRNLYNLLPKTIRLAHFTTSDELTLKLLNFINDADLILIKGSNSMTTDNLINFLNKINVI